MKKLDLKDSIFKVRKPTKAGRKLTSFETRSLVWEYWHKESTPSTITSRPAKLKVSDKCKIQTNLEFVDTVTFVKNKRGILFYLNPWRFTNDTTKCLYTKFLETHREHSVSYGTFLSLKPFYVRGATANDVEMCCCKMHLHARWSIQVLLRLFKIFPLVHIISIK